MGRIRNSRLGVWREVARIAGEQHGVVTRRQLLQAGASKDVIDGAVAAGQLYPLFRATYAVGHAAVGYRGRMIAAVLACGEGTVVSHGTGASLLGLWEFQPLEIDVIAPVEAGRKIDGVKRRFVPSPPPGQVVAVDAIPCTSISRTIVDMAGKLRRSALSRIVEQAAVLRKLDVPEIDSILAEHPRRGAKRLVAVLEPWRRYSTGSRIRSRMEAKLLPLLSLHDLPIPQTNVRLRLHGEAFEVDFLWPDHKVIVETDGGRFHENPLAEARDGHRNRVLARAGYKVPRIGWNELTADPEGTISEIRRFLRPAVP
jgi:very-short-patch-repair endonuclease